jgi:hypothetical protein
MKNPCSRFKQRVSVTFTTQFPEKKESFAQLIQQMLGPWCTSADVTLSNFDTEKYTPEQSMEDARVIYRLSRIMGDN